MSVPPAFDLQGLLAEDQWIRRVARKLAGDAHTAEDLAQETWAAALDTRSPRARALRPWLRGILRNLLIDAQRTSGARADRERIAAREEALGSTSELVAELELRKAVAEALLALEEPFRSALYLRFFKDQSLAAIAKRQGIAVTSAHERVQQGLARLRARLDQQHGGRRRAWAVGMLALAKPSGAWTTAAEALAMAGGLKLFAAAVLVGGGVAWWWVEGGSEGERAPLAAAPAVAERPESPASVLAPLETGNERAALNGPASAPAAAPSASSPPAAVALLQGRVNDPFGSPVASALVGWSIPAGAASARSGADGVFALEAAAVAEGAKIVCREPDLVTLVPGETRALDASQTPLVVVAPRASFAGVVLDPAGAPVPGARVVFGLRDALFRQLGLLRGQQERPEWRTTTDEAGAFELANVAGGERVFLQVEAAGFWIAIFDLPAASTADLVLRLERSDSERTIQGVVLDPAGATVADARVSAGDAIVATDAEGRFQLALGGHHGTFGPLQGAVEEPPTDVYLAALKPGFLPARERLAELALAAPVVLRLGARPASIAGLVVDVDGRSRAGVVVWNRDPTPFGRKIDSVAEGTTVAWSQTVEDELAGGYGERGTVSDAHGAFELGGLLERDYELMAFDPRTAELSGPWTIRAGSRGVELVLAREERRGRVAGRLVSLDGRPIPGVSIRPQRALDWGDAHAAPPFHGGGEVETDAQGRFEFAELALSGTQLQLQAEPFFFRTVALAAHADPEHLELVEPLLCELQVDLSGDPAFADALRVLDVDGHELETIESFGNGFSTGTEARITNGLSEVVVVKETARTLVLYQKGAEVLRRPLHLDPDHRTTVKP
jgi:RNA polymerase sigma factor (sigma-70 family)